MNCPLFPPAAARLADGSGGLFQVIFDGRPRAAVFGQPTRPIKHGQMAVSLAMYPHLRLDVVAAMPVCRNRQDQCLKPHAVVSANRALKLLAPEVIPLATHPRHDSGSCCQRRLLELGVEARQIDFRQVAIGGAPAGNVGQRQCLRQATRQEVFQRRVPSVPAPLASRRPSCRCPRASAHLRTGWGCSCQRCHPLPASARSGLPRSR